MLIVDAELMGIVIVIENSSCRNAKCDPRIEDEWVYMHNMEIWSMLEAVWRFLGNTSQSSDTIAMTAGVYTVSRFLAKLGTNYRQANRMMTTIILKKKVSLTTWWSLTTQYTGKLAGIQLNLPFTCLTHNTTTQPQTWKAVHQRSRTNHCLNC